jgi:Lyase
MSEMHARICAPQPDHSWPTDSGTAPHNEPGSSIMPGKVNPTNAKQW